MLKTTPAVFAVDHFYHIMVPVEAPSLMWVEIYNQRFYDEANGILCSLSPIHRIIVPMELLDKAQKYTVCERVIRERKPYFTETEEEERWEFGFTPVPSENIRIYHISDAHNDIDGPVKAAKAFGDFDLLILNGDILSDSHTPEAFLNIYRICDCLTKGTKPVIFSRGNHDLRGNCAELFAQYTPNYHGNTYYSFRLGSLWGIVLDCGEDKKDDHPAYGHTICCEEFRRCQISFIEEAISSGEFEDKMIKTRIVISHIPFTYTESPSTEDRDTYIRWSFLLNEAIKPQLMISGHTHEMELLRKDTCRETGVALCDVVTGGSPENNRFSGCGMIVKDAGIDIFFTDSNGERNFIGTVVK